MYARLVEAQRQHWLAVCHMLMSTDPAAADGSFAIYRGEESDFRPGWNRRRFGPGAPHPVLYTHIDTHGGTTTPVKPDVDEASIHEVVPKERPLEQRRLWQLATGHAGQMARLDLPEWSLEQLQRVLRSITRAHDRGADFRSHQAMFLRFLAQETERGGGQISDDQRRGLVANVVHGYLAFALSGHVASQVLAVALIMRRVVPGEPIEFVSGEETAARIDRLCDLAYQLFHLRDGRAPHTFYRMTFLGCLLGRAVAVLAQHRDEALGNDPVARERLARQAQLVEEEVVHHGFPTFVIPALFADPDRGTGYIARSLGDRDLDAVAIARVAHPGVKQILERWRSSAGAIDPMSEYYDLLATPSTDVEVEDQLETTFALL